MFEEKKTPKDGPKQKILLHDNHLHIIEESVKKEIPKKNGEIDFKAMDFDESVEYLTDNLDEQVKLLTDGIFIKFQEYNDRLVDSQENNQILTDKYDAQT